MKFFAMFVVMIALLTALCSAQPVDSLTPGQPDSAVNVRVKRGYIIRGRSCPSDHVFVMSRCLTFEQYEELLEDE